MAAYSFLDTTCRFVGPGIDANLAAGAAVAKEGITLSPSADKNKMDIGADGQGQHSLIADDSAALSIKLLKTSPQNAVLMIAYDLQTTSSNLWGINTVTLSNSARGDFSALQGVAFKKKPEILYGEEAGMMEWTFDIIQANTVLGGGI